MKNVQYSHFPFFICIKPEEHNTPVITNIIPIHCAGAIFTPSTKEIIIVTIGTRLKNNYIRLISRYESYIVKVWKKMIIL